MKDVFLILSFITCLYYVPEVYGQNSSDSVIVKIGLKNNDVLHGSMILENIPEYITIFTSDRDSMRVPVIMIKQVEITPVYGTQKRKPKLPYYNNISIGILTGRTNSSSPYRAMLSAEMVHGLEFTYYLSPGIGIAFDQYSNVSVLPFILSIRGDLLDQYLTPFYLVDIGTGPAWNTEEQFNPEHKINTGLAFHLATGLKIYSAERVNVHFSIGYKHQKVEFDEDLWDGSSRITDRTYKSMSFMIGIGI